MNVDARRAPLVGAALFAVVAAACSPGTLKSKSLSAQGITISISPELASVAPYARQAFTVTVSGTGDQSATWSIPEGIAGGEITSDGVYTAPATTGTYHVVATSHADETKSATATITVGTGSVTVAVSPVAPSVQVNGTVTFTCTVTGAADTACDWQASGGDITAQGVYTAPPTPGTYAVTATSRADRSKDDTTTVTVTAAAPAVEEVAVSPKAVTVPQGGTQPFTCIVTGGTTDRTCTWEATGGAITADGVYTAPAAAGSYVVTARSHADSSKTDTAIVTVPEVAVAVSPKNASVQVNGTQSFTCTVTGTANTSCTWSATRGSITAGAYRAPATAGSDEVTATSVADPSRSDTAAVTVTETPPAVSAVTVTPKAATVFQGGTQTFTCAVAGATTDRTCTWEATGGTITSAGLYTAPATAGSYVVTARSHADPSRFDTATVTVPQITVAISPKTATVPQGGTRTFSCTVTGAADTGCTWSATAGTITSAGLYTAPTTAGSYVVTATSRAGGRTDTATVTVPEVTVAVSPKTATVAQSYTQVFSCTVTGAADTGCTWSATGGSVSAAGLYRAPSTPGSYVVTATSRVGGKTDTAAVTVPAITVSISPATAAVDACQSTPFTCAVTGSPDTACNWSVQESGGGIVANGTYTAPATGGTYHVVAASHADPTKSRSAAVTVTERIVSVELSPLTATVAPGGTQQFTATVTTTCGAFTETATAGN
jgi:hypothetical protein